MKHRLLAVLMSAILLFASLPGITVQADTIGKEALACRELGILLGSDKSGVTAQYLAQIPTRLQAYIIALRLKGLYEEAGKYTSGMNFKDASAAAWARNYLAYAKNTPELGWTGYPDGSFGVNDKINTQAFYKVLLESLGYRQNVDFTYAQALDFADKIGLVDDAAEIAALKSFTINDIAKGIYMALNTNVAGTDKRLVELLVDKGVFNSEKVAAAGFNSIIQITAKLDLENGIAMVPVKYTYTKMGCYIFENDKTNMAYEIKKDAAWVRMTEGFTTAYINNTRVDMERPVMKDKAGIYYVPVSFILESAEVFGYDAEYNKSKNILRLQKSAEISAVQSEMVLARGDKRFIKVEKKYSEIEKEDITSMCTFAAASNDGVVQVGGTTGEVIGRNLGRAEIVINYQGKEVNRVTAYVVDVVPKHYPAAVYEQVFETTFRLDKPNFTDGFGTVWNKNTGVLASINEGDGIDTRSSLNILNCSAFESGVTVDLTKLLEDRAIRGKKITLKIYAKGISEGLKLYATADIRSKFASITKENSVALENKWKSIELLKLDIPADAQKLTLDLAAGQNEEIRIDAFTVTLNER